MTSRLSERTTLPTGEMPPVSESPERSSARASQPGGARASYEQLHAEIEAMRQHDAKERDDRLLDLRKLITGSVPPPDLTDDEIAAVDFDRAPRPSSIEGLQRQELADQRRVLRRGSEPPKSE